MSHATVELHENYPHEHIPDSDHETVQRLLGRIGFHKTATSGNQRERLPRACYYSDAGSADAMRVIHGALESLLKRKVRIELTLGDSYGFGLEPVAEPAMALPALLSSIAPLQSPGNYVPYNKASSALASIAFPSVKLGPPLVPVLAPIKKLG